MSWPIELMLGGQFGVGAQHLERPGGIAGCAFGDGEARRGRRCGRGCGAPAAPARGCRTARQRPRAPRGEQHLVDERLALVPAAVTADQLGAGAADGEVEDPRVRGVDDIQAHDLARRRLAGELGLAVDQHHVAVPAHRDERRPGLAEGRDVPVLDQQVIQGQGQLPVGGRPVSRVGGLDHDRAVQPHLQAEVLPDVRVVPVEPGVGELDLVGEGAADRDRRLGLVRDPVVTVLQPQPVPVHRRLDVAVVPHLHGDLRPLIDVQDRAGDRPVVGEHAQLGAVDVLAHRADPQVEPVPVVEPGHGRARYLGQARRLGREQLILAVRTWSGSSWPPQCDACTHLRAPFCLPFTRRCQEQCSQRLLRSHCRAGCDHEPDRAGPALGAAGRPRADPRRDHPPDPRRRPAAPGHRGGIRAEPAGHRPRARRVILGRCTATSPAATNC